MAPRFKRARRSAEGDDGEHTAENGTYSSQSNGGGASAHPPSPMVDGSFDLSQTDNPPPTTPRAGGPAAARGPLHPKKGKFIHDRVYNQIFLDGLLVAVMDTPEFQRLERIWQLGGCSYVYPSATHSRKEHSIGVSHLSGVMVKRLQAQQPELHIDEDDVRCVELAGLVHDLGHGPFSHMFENFMKRVSLSKPDMVGWEHEHMSAKVLHLLIRKNQIDLAAYFSQGSLPEEHVNFVVLLINGLKDDDGWPSNVGRPESKRFLVDIVSNSRNGIDVDKLDYLVRDSKAAFGSGSPAGFNPSRIIEACRVLPVAGGRPEVCFQMKVAMDINQIYALRAQLHRQVYQHHTANAAELMITDLLLEAEPHFTFRGADDKAVWLSQAATEAESFVLITDSIIEAIGMSMQSGLEKARELLGRLRSRKFYKKIGRPCCVDMRPKCDKCGKGTSVQARFCEYCGKKTMARPKIECNGVYIPPHTDMRPGKPGTAEAYEKEILDYCDPPPDSSKIRIHIVDIHHGKATVEADPWDKRKKWRVYSPLARVHFYNPKDSVLVPREIPKENLPGLYLPAVDFMRNIHCYIVDDDEELERVVSLGYEKWYDDKLKSGNYEQLGLDNSVSPSPRQASSSSNLPKARRAGTLDPRSLPSLAEEPGSWPSCSQPAS